ncbi:uncharacterized protein LOC127770570 isoform X2 [Oryza glaberrima]|uniref:uncharacterized protein LOC127770570 isoform X2 n=1 Tax=Oryza glaberrima TaxID=4538 RepID=UPI00224C0FAA|nr:uncharacterized protein LOC127770570 isoform X2 [Oryza glaberrima]
MKIEPRIARELQLNLNKHARKVQPGVARELQINQNMHVTKGVEKDVDNHNCTKQPKMTKKCCGETTSNHATTKRSKVPTVITQIAAEHMARYNNNKPTEIEGVNVGTTKHANVKRAALACENVVGRDVFLKRIVRPYNRVARATIQSQDPLEMVGGTMLGRECYKVVIDSLICGDAELFGPHRNLNYIRDAIGHCIAWPSQLVEEVSPQCNGEVTKRGARVSLKR